MANVRELFEKYAPMMSPLQPETCDILGTGTDDGDWKYPGASQGRVVKREGVPCRKSQLSAAEATTAARTGSQTQSKFMLPLGTPVSEDDTIRYKGELYPVIGVFKSTLELETKVYVGEGEADDQGEG